ncbi:MAG: hypothetical protein JWM82_3859 [Myxococcales bacterium]|nr:hypothetical protein [Myxococcales bacterium]
MQLTPRLIGPFIVGWVVVWSASSVAARRRHGYVDEATEAQEEAAADGEPDVAAAKPKKKSPPKRDEGDGAGEADDADGEANHEAADDDVEADDASGAKRAGPTMSASSALSAYSDTDSVHVITPTIAGDIRDDVAGWSVGGRYLVDAVSAASVDIVSSASGHWTEVRNVGSAEAAVKSGALGIGLAGGFSHEPDYLSVGGGGTLSVETLDKNVTPFIGASYGHDDVGRTGLSKAYWHTMQKGTVQLGVTFVVDKSTIAAVAVDGIFERGYLAKPYRYIPLFAPGIAAAIQPGASITEVNALRLDLRPVDALPDARDRYALGGRIAHRFDASTVRADGRLYHDNWGMTAVTGDARLLLDVGERFMLWPHARFHAQQGVDLWQRAYQAPPAPDGTPTIPRYRTGDRELGPLYTWTAGAGARARIVDGRRQSWSLTFEVEGIFSRYLDALYITQRRALFGNLSLEATFE